MASGTVAGPVPDQRLRTFAEIVVSRVSSLEFKAFHELRKNSRRDGSAIGQLAMTFHGGKDRVRCGSRCDGECGRQNSKACKCRSAG